MRVKSKPSSSLSQQSFSCSSSRTRKKHKRLDAICENTYNENHGGSSEKKARAGDTKEEPELRRSTRMRRAPVLLDSSPPPVKKRRKLNNIGRASSARKEKSLSPRDIANEEDSFVDVGIPDSWKSRLKPRGRRHVNSRSANKIDSPRGKRRLFGDINVEEEEEHLVERKMTKEEKGETDEDTAELEVGSSPPVKKKRVGKIKAAASLGDEENMDNMDARSLMLGKATNEGKLKEVTALEDGEKRGILDSAEEVESVGNEISGHGDGSGKDLSAETDTCIEDQVEIMNANETSLAEGEEGKVPDAACAEVGSTRDDSVTAAEHAEEIMEEVEDGTCVISGTYDKQVDEEVVDKVEGDSHGRENFNVVKLDQKPAESGQSKKFDPKIRSSSDTMGLSFIKGGRRCSLCGGGTDGKPPKKLMNENGESENEAFNGSSPSEEPNYDIWDGFGDEPNWLGRLLGPINDRYGIAGIWVHQHCAVWSPEVRYTDFFFLL